MADMFFNCYYITSLNLSNFNTSKVNEFNFMFHNCQSLTSLNLSNFDTSNLNRTDRMFDGCINLEYINMQNFNEETINSHYVYIFYQVPDNIVICINPNLTQNTIFPQIKDKACYNIDCSNDWILNQKKIISETNQCVNNCNDTIRDKIICRTTSLFSSRK